MIIHPQDMFDLEKHAARLREEHEWLIKPITHLYHGTSSSVIDSILKTGIKPRAVTKRDNWKKTVSSRATSVYLTAAYPLHFASATNDGDLAVLEIDRSMLDPLKLHADEDAIEQSHRGSDSLPSDWSIKRRTIYYRSRAHLFSGEDSLRVMGTAAYDGAIPPKAFTRLALIPQSSLADLIMMGHDPMISIGNYKFMGGKYRAFVAWIFGDREVDLEMRNELKIEVKQLR